MISFLRGQILDRELDHFTIDVNGVGYEIHCSQNTLDHLTNQVEVNVYIYTHVREDAITLFGFSTKAEKEMFLSLNKVNGIGPKMAQKILSGAPLERLIQMVEEGDVSGLSKLPKVGKKTAEQMILSLKGKLVLSEATGMSSGKSSRGDIVSALVNLGFKINDAERAVEKLPQGIDFEEGVKQGLQALTNL